MERSRLARPESPARIVSRSARRLSARRSRPAESRWLFFTSGSVGELDGARRNLVRRRDILERRANIPRGRNAIDGDFLAARRVVIRKGEDQRGTVFELNQLLLRGGAVGADADRLAAMIFRNRASQDFGGRRRWRYR